MQCFNCQNSDFIDGVLICRAFKLGPIKIAGYEPCRGVFFDSVYKIGMDDIIGFPKRAYYPSHPDRIVIRKKAPLKENISEAMVWDYYDKVKRHMIPFLKNKDLAVQVFSDSGTILKRHKSPKEKKYLSVSNIDDFDEINNGRNIAWYIGERKDTDVAIVDTDPGENVTFDRIKEHTLLVMDILKNINMIDEIDCLYTGKRGFHVWGWLKRKRKIDEVRGALQEILESEFADDEHITITKKPKSGQIRMDISINKEAGLHICPLSIRFETGLVAWWVPKNKIRNFDKKTYTIYNILRRLR